MNVRIATTIRDLDAVCAVRFRAFASINAADLEDRPTGRDIDCFDTIPESTLFLGEDRGEPVCSVRLTTPIVYLRETSSVYAVGLGFEKWWALHGIASSDPVAELPRTSVVPEHQHRGVIVSLYRYVLQHCRLHGIEMILAAAPLLTDCEEDAMTLYQLAEQRELLSKEYSFPIANNFAGHSLRKLRSCSLERIPEALRLYTGLGARICGHPAYLPFVKCYCVPIIIKTKNAPPLLLRSQ